VFLYQLNQPLENARGNTKHRGYGYTVINYAEIKLKR